jgi:hypothetical protein
MSMKSHSPTQDAFPQEGVIPEPRGEGESRSAELERLERQTRVMTTLRLLWARRSFLFRVAACGFIISMLVAFLIPKRYTPTARLMPSDSQSTSGFAMAAAALEGRSNCEAAS